MNKDFIIGQLFTASTGDVDLQQKDINGRGVFFINSGVENRGIKGKTDKKARIFPSNTITIDFWGNAYYRDFEYKLATHNHVFSLSGDVIKDEKVGLYLATVLSKLSQLFSYNNMATWNKLKVLSISLPVIKNLDPDHIYTTDDIDYQYMRERIVELERERIVELERERIVELDAYLQAAGLNDYELTEEDKKILSDNTVVFSDKLIGTLFIKVEAKCKKLDFDKRKDTSTEPNDEFCVPLINAKLGDNGVMFYGRPDDWNTQSMCIDVVQNGAVATGKVYAQPQSTAVLWDAYLIKPIRENVTEEVLLYLARCIEKLTKERFSYEKKATWERIKECNITIPITSDGEPDFDYMERYIRAMEKVVIADVVKYKDKVIETTKQIAG